MANFGFILLLVLGCHSVLPTFAAKVLEQRGSVSVVETNDLFFLTTKETIIGAMFSNPNFRDQAAFNGFAIMQAGVVFNQRMENKIPPRVLQIGLGAGIVPTLLRKEGFVVDTVEISRDVALMASKYFEYELCEPDSPSTCGASGITYVTDGIDYIQNKEEATHDIIVCDVFAGSNPDSFFNEKIFSGIKKIVATKGLVIVNFVGFQFGKFAVVGQEIKRALSRIFAFVQCFRDIPPDYDPTGAANLIFFASDKAINIQIPNTGFYENPEEFTTDWIVKRYQTWEVFVNIQADSDFVVPISPEREIFMDEFEHTIKESLRNTSIDYFPEEVWTSIHSHLHDIGEL